MTSPIGGPCLSNVVFFKDMFGTVRTGAHSRFYSADISSTGHFSKFGSTSTPIPAVPIQTFVPVPDTSVSSVRH